MRSSRAGGRVPLITPTASTRPMKKISQNARPGTVRCSRSVGRTFYLSGKQQFPGGHADAIGRRPTMEDACVCVGEFAGPRTQYYAVFDGHGGREASAYCAEKLHSLIASKYVKGVPLGPIISKSIHEINQNIISTWEYAGTTAAIAIIADDKIYTANVGDSRVILVKDQKAIRLSVDHKATFPRERRAVLKRGGSIFQGRVNGILMLSRAIGDATVSRYITAEPYQTETPFQEGLKLILACDGVWDVMSDQNAADIFNHSTQPVDAARAIKNEALKRGSMDNVSVICVDLTYKDDVKDYTETQYQNESPRHSRRQPLYKEDIKDYSDTLYQIESSRHSSRQPLYKDNNILFDKERLVHQNQEIDKDKNEDKDNENEKEIASESNQNQEKNDESEEEVTDSSEKNDQEFQEQQEQQELQEIHQQHHQPQKQQKQHYQQKQQQKQQINEFAKPQHLQIQSLHLTLQKTKPQIVVTKKQNQQNNQQYQQFQQYFKTTKIQGYQLEPRPPKTPNQENQLGTTLTIHRPHRQIRQQDSK